MLGVATAVVGYVLYRFWGSNSEDEPKAKRQKIEDEKQKPEAPKYVQLEDSKLQSLLKQFFNDAINTLYIEIAIELKKKTGNEEISLQ